MGVGRWTLASCLLEPSIYLVYFCVPPPLFIRCELAPTVHWVHIFALFGLSPHCDLIGPVTLSPPGHVQ